jgi:hypothetical protein
MAALVNTQVLLDNQLQPQLITFDDIIFHGLQHIYVPVGTCITTP